MSNYAIEVKGLSKKFILDKRRKNSLKDIFSFRGLSTNSFSHEEFWALKDVNFNVNFGQSVAIIGKNGSGKSTLLKILSRVVHPTDGKFFIKGRLISLLEVGTGFHSELSGRENVYLNGSILGMSKEDINTRFDEIVEFSGVKEFIDMPVKTYSSGMYIRLAFSVAAHLDPEVFIIDEVLAVGDNEFQQKCQEKLKEISQREGRTVLFVGHRIALMRNLTERGIILKKGQIYYDGQINDALDKYLYDGQVNLQKGKIVFPEMIEKDAQMLSFGIMNSKGDYQTEFDIFEDKFIEISYLIRRSELKCRLALTIERNGSILFKSFDNDFSNPFGEFRKAGTYKSIVKLPQILKAGYYSVRLVGVEDFNDKKIHMESHLAGFEVKQDENEVTMMKSYHKARWGEIIGNLDWKSVKQD